MSSRFFESSAPYINSPTEIEETNASSKGSSLKGAIFTKKRKEMLMKTVGTKSQNAIKKQYEDKEKILKKEDVDVINPEEVEVPAEDVVLSEEEVDVIAPEDTTV